jgi:GATA-binding protein
MSHALPLPSRFVEPRHSSLPPDSGLTKTSLLKSIRHSYPFVPLHSSTRRHMTSSPISSGSSEPAPASSQQLAHQLAAETLLTMAASKSPDTRTEARRALPGTTSATSTPSAPTTSTSTLASVPAPARSNAMDVDTPESRGIKRKNGEDESRFWSGASLGLDRLGDRERSLSKERVSRSPLASAEPKPAQPLPQAQPHSTSRLGSNASPGLAGSSPANRYSIYGPTAPESALYASPWGALTEARYGSLGIRRDISPAVSTASTTTPAATTAATAAAAKPLSPPRRTSPETTPRDSRLYPSASLGGYGHYGMGRRELQEHREQLRQGKRWLDTMLAKAEKMLHMVENKRALTGEPIGATTSTTTSTTAGAGSSTTATAASPGPRPGQSTEDWEYEERERARAKEIQRLEEERERDRAEKDRREKERREKERREKEMRLGLSPAVLDRAALELERERERDRERLDRLERETARERERLSAIYDRGRDTDKIGHIGLNPLSALSGLARDRSEIERNRDHILTSRRISAISPAQSANAAQYPTVGAAGTAGASGTTVKREGTAASGAGAGAAGAGAKDGAATAGSSAGTVTGAAGTAATARKSPWDGDPILAGVAMPRRDQGTLARGLGRGLWSFDVRG